MNVDVCIQLSSDPSRRLRRAAPTSRTSTTMGMQWHWRILLLVWPLAYGSKFVLIELINNESNVIESFPASVAKFGQNFPPEEPLQLPVVTLADQALGCSPFSIPTEKSKFALVVQRGGGCSFQTKVQNGQNAGASVVVVAGVVEEEAGVVEEEEPRKIQPT